MNQMSKPTHPLVPPEFTPEQRVILETPVLASATYVGKGSDLQKMVLVLVTFCFIGLGSMFFTAKDAVGDTPWLAVLFLYPLAIAIAWKFLPNRSWRSCGLTLTEAGVVYHDQDFIHAYHWHEISELKIWHDGSMYFIPQPLLGIAALRQKPLFSISYDPALKQILIDLVEGKIKLPEGTTLNPTEDNLRLLAGS